MKMVAIDEWEQKKSDELAIAGTSYVGLSSTVMLATAKAA
jgi:GTP-binding protein EngB required for normal cell division